MNSSYYFPSCVNPNALSSFPTNYCIPPELCTLSTCDLTEAHFTYVPTLAGNSLYLAIFAVVLILQIGLGVFYKTWGFLVGMIFGLVLEIVGYAARVMMSKNPFTSNPFLIYLICLTIGPAFLSGAIYLCLARIITAYGEHLSRFQPRTYTITFMSCDFFSLVLQAIGGAIADTAGTTSAEQTGVNIMIAGLSFQVVSLVVFIVLCSDFARHVFQRNRPLNAKFDTLRQTKRFRGFLWALGLATICILIRSSFRVAELSQGFHGPLANQQITFMILEGAMVIIAVCALTAYHPGLAFQGSWAAVTFHLRASKANHVEMASSEKGSDSRS